MKSKDERGKEIADKVLGRTIRVWRGSKPMRAKRSPGRNTPCTCGSGKKFKHCCGRPPK